jgi:hypothetical protein
MAPLVDHIVTGIGTIVVGVVGWVWRLGNRTDNHQHPPGHLRGL